jgi:hypothetical protein
MPGVASGGILWVLKITISENGEYIIGKIYDSLDKETAQKID